MEKKTADEFIPFGKEWEMEIMKMSKVALVEIFRRSAQQAASLQSKIEALELDLTEARKIIDLQKKKMLFTDACELPAKDAEYAELQSRYRELEGLAEKLELALVSSRTIMKMADNHITDLNISNSINHQNDRSRDTLTAYRNFKAKEASNEG